MVFNKKVLVMTVGGSPEPLIYSIDNLEPDLVYFIHSKKSLDTIQTVLDKTKHDFPYKNRGIENHESIEESYKISKEVLFELNKENYKILIDFTGGTKPMVGGLVLASTGDKYSNDYEYYYVGSKPQSNKDVSRDKNGLGIVITGQESMKSQKDPYETYAVIEFNRGRNFFNHYQFDAAAQNFEDAKLKLEDSSLKELSDFYLKLVNFYQVWDKFNIEIEVFNEKLNKNETFKLPRYLYKELIEIAPVDLLKNDLKNYDGFISQLNANLDFLRLKISRNSRENMKYYLPDLLNNAYRKIEEGFYDDAVARLYRAIELIAQLMLDKEGLIDITKFKNNQVFHINREKFNLETQDNYKARDLVKSWNLKEFDNREKTFKLHKSQSLSLLRTFDNLLAGKLATDRKLDSSLTKRNNSILAHGLNPIDKKSALELYNLVLDYSIIFWDDIEKYMEMAKFPKF